jgi:hypothetical protein
VEKEENLEKEGKMEVEECLEKEEFSVVFDDFYNVDSDYMDDYK